MKVLIGYDGSDCADAALEDLQRAGFPRAVDALVISVAEQWLPPPPPSSYEIVEETFAEGIIGGVVEANRQASQAVEDARSKAFQASKVVRSLFPNWTVSSEEYVGSPAREILRRAGKWEADLIVVGSHGRSALGRLFLGSVSQRVVTDATCSVRVARHQAQEKDSPVRIIIGIDGSAGSALALRRASARSWPKGSEVRLVTSVDPLHMYAMDPDDKFAFARSFHQAAETTLRDVGLRVESLVKEEDPKFLLIEEAERCNADSIFIGARGLNRVERFVLGSVSTAVVARAHCSVEVAR
ncbi:MAG TPA: universal stress protein [Blastocatellia bacterium]|nr:universal stress protein [Blastocatellia bacterium]